MREAEDVATAPSGTGIEVWWQEQGSGDPVLLINGLSSPSGTWFRLAGRLAPRFRVLTFDNRGTGRTGVPEGSYSVETMAQDAVAVLDAAGVASAHVVGLSMGGLIAQELALTAPDRLRSLVLASTHAGIPHGGDADPEIAAALAGAAGLPAAERTKALAPFLYAPGTSQLERDRDEAARAAAPTDESGYVRQLVGVAPWERLADLSSLAMPVMVLHGALDRLVPPRFGERLAAAIPHARHVVLEGAAHALFTDQEEVAATAVSSFFSHVTVRT